MNPNAEVPSAVATFVVRLIFWILEEFDVPTMTILLLVGCPSDSGKK